MQFYPQLLLHSFPYLSFTADILSNTPGLSLFNMQFYPLLSLHSFRYLSFHSLWKASNISPIPKEKPPSSESDFRPISLTPCLAKVLEEFVAEWLINDIKDMIDPKQFGCLKGTSTNLCPFHNWLSSLDSPGQYVRICYLDFSKAFDRINLNILVQILIAIGARLSLIKWISNSLSDRTQRVKIGDSFSYWTHTHAGVPQGTKLGPILFLIMVNNLASSSPLNLDHWIFVDDLTTSETVPRLEHPKMQQNIINLETWSESNYMKLNPKKCKEMCVCVLKNKPNPNPSQSTETR